MEHDEVIEDIASTIDRLYQAHGKYIDLLEEMSLDQNSKLTDAFLAEQLAKIAGHFRMASESITRIADGLNKPVEKKLH